MLNILFVGLGGFAGSVSRYLVYVFFRSHFPYSFPLATLAVNTVGCFLIGIVFSQVDLGNFSTQPRLLLFLTVGILGGFTTFSAFGLETAELLQQHHYLFAFLNISANLVLGIGAVFLGKMLFAS